MKICKKCGDPDAEFHKCTGSHDGLQHYCKACAATDYAKYCADNADKRKASKSKYRLANREKVNAANALWRANNPDKTKASKAKYRTENPSKVSAQLAAWRAANPEKYKAGKAKWQTANPEKKRAISAKYCAENHDKVKAMKATWRAKNPEACRIYVQNRNARKREVGGELSIGLADRLFRLQMGKCACGCKQALGTDYHRDHIMPIALGGTNTDDNIQLLRAVCNLKKGAKDPIAFMQSKGFLL